MSIVYTCFCTDVIHKGHLNLINEAKKYGDVVYLAPDEEEDLRKIQATGCELFMQQLPTTKRDPLKL